MTTFLVFSITRAKEISMDIVEFNDEVAEQIDPYEKIAEQISPPYLGECVIVKQDDVRRFKLKSHVVEILR